MEREIEREKISQQQIGSRPNEYSFVYTHMNPIGPPVYLFLNRGKFESENNVSRVLISGFLG